MTDSVRTEVNKVIIGVDPGLSGVITIRQPDMKVLTFPCPFTMYKEKYARPVIDVEQWDVICNAIYEAAQIDSDDDESGVKIFALIESPAIHGGMDSNVAVAGIHWYAGCLDAAFRLQDWNIEIEYVRPQQWQACLIHPFITAKGYPYPKGGKGARAQWKQLAIEYVRERYGAHVLKFSRGRKENDNIADSICISEYAEGVLSGRYSFHRSWIYTPRKKWKNAYTETRAIAS